MLPWVMNTDLISTAQLSDADLLSEVQRLAGPSAVRQCVSLRRSRKSTHAAAPTSDPKRTPPGSERVSASRPVPVADVVQPLAPDRYKLQLTISRATGDKLFRARD
jgi:hypothetical protein